MRSLLIVSIVVLVLLESGLAQNRRGQKRGPKEPNVPKVGTPDKVIIDWIEQPLDHFNSSEKRRWKQKYMLNDRFHNVSGPAFFLFSGESPMPESWVRTAGGTYLTDWQLNARDFGAITFQLEHRYFGESIPIPDPEKAENMKWLHSRQALADTAEFIKFATKKYRLEGSPWVVFGGSYSGALSAWMRALYPDLVVGAISSSGGLHGVMNYQDYMEVTGIGLRKHSENCYKQTEIAFNKVYELYETEEGRRELEDKLNLCHKLPPNDWLEKGDLINMLKYPFGNTCQYGGDNRAPFDNHTIPGLCEIIEDTANMPDPLDRLLKVYKWNQRSNSTVCMDNSFDESVEASFVMNDNRGWDYLCCNELGLFVTTESKNQPFGDGCPTALRAENCRKLFGYSMEDVAKNVDRTNALYGGNRNYNGTNVVIINGSQDPFYKLGLYDESWARPGQTVVLMKDIAHCGDMYEATPLDPPEVVRAKRIVREHLEKWLGPPQNVRH